MKRILAGLLALTTVVAAHAAAPKPLRALIIAGGCCHDYGMQPIILKEGLEARAHIEVDYVVSVDAEQKPDRTTKAKFAKYEKPDWAKGYDVIIHDECSSDVKDLGYVNNILAAHKAGVPAVNLHCAMHSYRVGQFRDPVLPGSSDSLWFDLLGIQSTGHGPQVPIQVTIVDKSHAITKPLAAWTTVNEELYNNIKIFPTAIPLMKGRQVIKQKDGTEKEVESVVTWGNLYGKTRVFSSTLGHNNATVGDPRYLDMVTRGLLWSCDKLNDTYLKPTPGDPVPPSAKPFLLKAAEKK
ncbi:MAG: ThuA domain-containing protein [Limisphaerales bacterium]